MISDKTRKLLWGKAGNSCALCKRELIVGGDSESDPTIVGQECHIRSGKQGGPRYDADFPPEWIDSYDNLLLLCPTHHRIVDDQPVKYVVDELVRTKRDHELWVKKKRDVSGDANDADILQQFGACFQRPAFTTPFQQESSLPDFKKAITDTIEAINTGVYRLRDGTVIQKRASVFDLRDDGIRQEIIGLVRQLEALRAKYDLFFVSEEIRHCGCGDDNCPVHFISSRACHEMNQARYQVLERFDRLFPTANLRHAQIPYWP